MELPYEKYRLEYGDILIARMADPGHAAFIEEEIEGVFASYLIRFRLIDTSLDRYLQYWLRSNVYWAQADGAKIGTTRSSLNAPILSSFELVIPPKDVCLGFSEIVVPLRQMITENNRQSRTLAQLRDTLLPRLISGELRVPELADDWHAFIERTAGSLSDDPIQRWPQGDYEERDALE